MPKKTALANTQPLKLPSQYHKPPSGMLLLEDGQIFYGHGYGASGFRIGELCFNTSTTGYQETLSDPSYACQIIVFTFPHIGNVGCNQGDMESPAPRTLGCITAEMPTKASNWRSEMELAQWLSRYGLIGLAGLDTRSLTIRLRQQGAIKAAIVHQPEGLQGFDIDLLQSDNQANTMSLTAPKQRHGQGQGQRHGQGHGHGHSNPQLLVNIDKSPQPAPQPKNSKTKKNAVPACCLSDIYQQLTAWPGLAGLDLASGFDNNSGPAENNGGTTKNNGGTAENNDGKSNPYRWWNQSPQLPSGDYPSDGKKDFTVAVIDFGMKTAIPQLLSKHGLNVTIIPANITVDEFIKISVAGVVLSNGPGDPAATFPRLEPLLSHILAQRIPVCGICLGFQLLCLALGARSYKMAHGHHGSNHPVIDKQTGKVQITAQNHGFAIAASSLPAEIESTHFSLFDETLEGIRHRPAGIIGVQYHPEASPGPTEAIAVIQEFISWLTP